MTILVGACSWTGRDPAQSRRFYRVPNPTPEQMLRRYPTVEVDIAFYALPSHRNAQLWEEKTPADFVFHVKAFSLYTLTVHLSSGFLGISQSPCSQRTCLRRQ